MKRVEIWMDPSFQVVCEVLLVREHRRWTSVEYEYRTQWRSGPTEYRYQHFSNLSDAVAKAHEVLKEWGWEIDRADDHVRINHVSKSIG